MSKSESEYQLLPSIYETYLCTEPAGNVPLLIRNGPDEYTAAMRTLQRSADHFAEQNHIRAVERLQWEMAKVHMQNEQWERAARVLTPLWQTLSWRKAGWWNMLQEIDWALRNCASRIRDLETLIATEWELFDSSLTPKQDSPRDFSKTLEPFKPLESRPKVIVRAGNLLSFLSATFAFSAPEGHVGVALHSQVVVTSRARSSSTPVTISNLKVAFEGNLSNLTIRHESSETEHVASAKNSVNIQKVTLRRATPQVTSIPTGFKPNHSNNDLTGSADLTVFPGSTKVFSIEHIPRYAENVEVTSLVLEISANDFDLDLIVTEDEHMNQLTFWHPLGVKPPDRTLSTKRSSAVKVLPKPPKMRIEIRDVATTYFTDEIIALNIWMINDEDNEADLTLEARIVGSGLALPRLMWTSPGEEATFAKGGASDGAPDLESGPISKEVGRINPASDETQQILVKAISEPREYVIEVRARYHLLSDPETPISKFTSAHIRIEAPFEISYDFVPMIDDKSWPNYFEVDEHDEDSGTTANEEKQSAEGISQKWLLTSRLYSLANIAVSIQNVEPRVLEVQEAASCNIVAASEDHSRLTTMKPHDLQERNFVLNVQKADLDDSRVTYLNLRLEILWLREEVKSPPMVPIITPLMVPELIIPFGEPRVLARAKSGEVPQGIIHMDYVIENPSTYALTFNVTMETSEEFAFGGAKNVSLELLPLTRHVMRYKLMPLVKGTWISPKLRIFDTHFHKALKIYGTEGMRNDKQGASVWVDADG